MRSVPPPPPRFAEDLLALALPDDGWGEAVLGDLHEEHAAFSRERGSRLARLWYLGQVWRLGARYLGRSLIGSRSDGPRSPKKKDSMIKDWFHNDFLHAVRSLAKRPSVSLVIAATLTIALAANASTYSIIDALIVRPLSFDAVDEIVILAELEPGQMFRPYWVAPANFLDWREGTSAFESLIGAQYWETNLTGGQYPEHVQGFRVSPGFFETLRVNPQLGRALRQGEEIPGQDRVAILGAALWARRFGEDPGVLGKEVVLNGAAHTIVGVAPQGFDFPLGAEVWVPLGFNAEEAAERSSRYITAVGRLAEGRTFAEAEAQITAIDERLHREHPEDFGSRRVVMKTLSAGMADPGAGPFLLIWQFSALLVLLVACANVATLLLSRGSERQRELAVRMALGAARGRIVRQLVTEGALLSVVAGIAALPLAALALNMLRGSLPAEIARFVAGWRDIDVDGRTFLFTLALGTAASIIFAGLPALAAVRPRLSETLREGGRSATESGRRQLGRNSLVVAEVALALALLVASTLAAQSALKMLHGPQGYDVENLLVMQTVLPEEGYEDENRIQFARDIRARLEQLPGATGVLVSNTLPSLASNGSQDFEIEGAEVVPGASRPRGNLRTVSPDFFDVLGLPVTDGRAIDERDGVDAERTLVVSQSFADRHWPGQNPLGRRVKIFSTDDPPWHTVVGVSGDVIHHWFGNRNEPTMYVSYEQMPRRALAIAVRTSGQPGALIDAARLAVQEVDPNQPLHMVKTMEQSIALRTIGLQFAATIMAALALIALVLAVSGVYGLMAYRVSQRTHEIGLRVALGASEKQILALTLGQAGRLTALGVGIGLPLAFALARLMEGAFEGVLEVQPLSFLVFAAILFSASLLAGFVPARRALGVDPAIALREE